MDQTEDSRVVLLSIHPEYADAILEGTKRVEFRKPPFPRDASHVVIYATAPVRRVVGWFEVGAMEERSPATLWRKYAAVGGIERSDFGSYYSGRTRAVAIHVSGPTKLRKALPLSALDRDLVPPQNYRYLERSALSALQRSA